MRFDLCACACAHVCERGGRDGGELECRCTALQCKADARHFAADALNSSSMQMQAHHIHTNMRVRTHTRARTHTRQPIQAPTQVGGREKRAHPNSISKRSRSQSRDRMLRVSGARGSTWVWMRLPGATSTKGDMLAPTSSVVCVLAMCMCVNERVCVHTWCTYAFTQTWSGCALLSAPRRASASQVHTPAPAANTCTYG